MFKIQKSDKTQIRVEQVEYQGRAYVNMREWYDAGGEYKPTKKGFMVPPEYLEEFIAGLQKMERGVKKPVLKVKAETVFILAESKEDALMHKKLTYKTVEEAKKKKAPDGFYIFQAEVKNGAVVAAAPICKRVEGVWKQKK